jgi:hypothetical protein
VRKDRDPELFAVLDDNVHSQIASSKAQIEDALKQKYRTDSIGFAEATEVAWLCAMLWLLYPEVSSDVLVPGTETRLFFCWQAIVTANCKLNYVANGSRALQDGWLSMPQRLVLSSNIIGSLK